MTARYEVSNVRQISSRPLTYVSGDAILEVAYGHLSELIPGYDQDTSCKETTRGLQTIYPLEIQHDVDPPVNVSVDGSREAEAGQEEGGASAPKKKPPRKKKKESPRRTRDSGGEDVADHDPPPDGQLKVGPTSSQAHYF
ncbi:hypothetical protein OUZ56_011207 [Daphnia magna]|uniref:Uncharacterized protein n=1 Tax=Daphnia magna TaxID=35525 RepID=A0ABQ9YZJ3_9CRUS|nr:hypothetical protein OUZ56_011207 [Daphnia magna]